MKKQHRDLLKRMETLINIPSGEVILSAKTKELEVMLSHLIEDRYADRLIGNGAVKSDSPTFNLRNIDNDPKDWDVMTDVPEIHDKIFTKQLVDFLISHEVNPERQYDRIFKSRECTTHLVFCRWELGRITGKFAYRFNCNHRALKIVQPMPTSQLSTETKYRIFKRIIESDADALEDILEYFFEIYHPLNLADAV